MRDILVDPPRENRYAALKNELIKRLSTSQAEKTRQLLKDAQMGDKTPSQFLRVLRDLAGRDVHDHLLREIWVSRLSNQIRPILAIEDDKPLDRLAKAADGVYHACRMNGA